MTGASGHLQRLFDNYSPTRPAKSPQPVHQSEKVKWTKPLGPVQACPRFCQLHICSLKDQLRMSRKTSDLPMEGYLRCIWALVDSLASLGVPIQENEIVEYVTCVTNLFFQGPKAFDEIYSLLITQDLQFQRFNNL